MKDIFMVQLDWSTTDADGIDTELYEDYGDAYDRYKEIITEQLKNFWDGEVVFDTDGDPGKDYEFSEEDNNSNESEVYWHLSLKDDYYFHTFVDLFRVPLYTKHEDGPVFTVRYGGVTARPYDAKRSISSVVDPCKHVVHLANRHLYVSAFIQDI